MSKWKQPGQIREPIYTCPSCGGENTITVTDAEDYVVYEAETRCTKCSEANFWSYGYFQERA